MNDRFGQVMLENLSQRGCGLPGVKACQGMQKMLSLVVMVVYLDMVYLRKGYCLLLI